MEVQGFEVGEEGEGKGDDAGEVLGMEADGDGMVSTATLVDAWDGADFGRRGKPKWERKWVRVGEEEMEREAKRRRRRSKRVPLGFGLREAFIKIGDRLWEIWC